jgi:hypothetical protein
MMYGFDAGIVSRRGATRDGRVCDGAVPYRREWTPTSTAPIPIGDPYLPDAIRYAEP